MASHTLVVDRSLEALPLKQVLDARARLKLTGAFERRPAPAPDRPVLGGGQALTPNTLYPAEKNQSLRYYLPEFRIAADAEGRPQVELRYQPGENDEVGRLTIDFTWTPPQAPGLALRVIDHTATLVLRFHVPVQDAAGAATQGPGWEHTVPLQPAQQAGHLLVRSTTVFTEKSVFDMVYQALRSEEPRTSIDIAVRARVGVRTWRQVIVGRPTELDQVRALRDRNALFTQLVHEESLAGVRSVPASGTSRIRLAGPPAGVEARVAATRSVVANPAIRRMIATPAAAGTAAPPAVRTLGKRRRPVAGAGAASLRGTAFGGPRVRVVAGTGATAAPAASAAVVAAPVIERATLTRVNAPTLAAAVAASDMRVDSRAVVPIRAVLDMNRVPAVVDTEVEMVQTLRTWFDPSLPQHADVFAVQGFDSGGIHLLLPLRLSTPDGSAHVVYQDNLMRDVVHVAPGEFRLERDEVAPYLPALSFLASEFSTTDAAGSTDAEVLFRVSAVYRLEPWIDPDVIELARVELARQGLAARFTTSVARDAKLVLDLDLLGAEQERSEATVDPATGITDTLELDHASFLRVWREHLANPAAGGVGGRVEYRLFDGSLVQARVRMSLHETSADLFDVAYVGPIADQPGRHRVRIRNRIESPARITALPPAQLDAALAHAVDAGTLVGQLFQPQESRDVLYEAPPGVQIPADFEPLVVAQVEPNLPALLKLLMLTPGYSALGFTVPVKAAANAFAPREQGEALTGLLVEFDDGTRITLTPSQPQADASLVGRLLDQILGTGDSSQRYFYRVTNLHATGEGARTSWLEGQGTGPLEVGLAAVRLDF